jgi:tetratricopeptide (TPR) repeat protein
MAATVLMVPAEVAAQSDEARHALLSGRYDDAIAAWEALRDRGEASAADVRGLLTAFLRTGQYGRAIDTGRAHLESTRSTAAEANNMVGEALYATGDLDAARRYFEAAIEAGAADALTARLNLAIADFERGARDDAMAAFDDFIDVYNAGEAQTADDLIAVARACTYLGLEDPQLFHDAVRAFDAAIAADPANPEPRLMLGELFLDKYDSTEAAGLLAEALQLDAQWARTHLAEARRLQFDGGADAMARVERALELNPNLVAAHVLRATMLLSTGNREAAAEGARLALAINPRSPQALALAAAVQYLDDDRTAYAATVAAARQLNPRSAVLLVTVAEQAAQNRLYAEAVGLAGEAVDADPVSWEAWGTLGLNQLRIGQIDAGRTSLERAFAGDPFNVWYKNTLDLLDTFVDYRTVETANFSLVIRDDRADLVAPYMAAVAEDAWAALTTKYGYTPPDRVRVEVFERHADFSVRTVGLAGLGALGVAFGPVVAVDAPGVPGMGEFNWGATLWHEIAHVIAMGVSGSRVPRWFTEGLSVYEEHRARPGWGEHVDPGFLVAYMRGDLLPVSRINEGFFRPRYPAHLGHSYVQASLVHEFFEEQFGFDVIPAMLRGYGAGQNDTEVVAEVLGWEMAQLDARFDEYVRARFAGPMEALEAQVNRAADDPSGGGRPQPLNIAEIRARADADPDDFVAQLQTGSALAGSGDVVAAEPYLRRAKGLFPSYGGPDSPYLGLARVHEAAGDPGAAARELSTLVALSDKHLAARLRLAEILEATGQPAGAAAALETAFYIDLDLPEELADAARLHEQEGNWSGVVRARRALLGLDPTDRAAAQYDLARAHLGAGDVAAARRAVLGALEIAPSYTAAQSLLLEIRARQEDT